MSTLGRLSQQHQLIWKRRVAIQKSISRQVRHIGYVTTNRQARNNIVPEQQRIKAIGRVIVRSRRTQRSDLGSNRAAHRPERFRAPSATGR